MRKSRIETNYNWIKALNKIKSELQDRNYDSVTKLVRNEKINDSWAVFLRKNNIIIEINGFWKWNDKIPISIKLIEKFREYQTSKIKKTIIKKQQQRNLFDMPSSALPPKPKVTKTQSAKIQVNAMHEPKIELGVIRRFLKWLW